MNKNFKGPKVSAGEINISLLSLGHVDKHCSSVWVGRRGVLFLTFEHLNAESDPDPRNKSSQFCHSTAVHMSHVHACPAIQSCCCCRRRDRCYWRNGRAREPRRKRPREKASENQRIGERKAWLALNGSKKERKRERPTRLKKERRPSFYSWQHCQWESLPG